MHRTRLLVLLAAFALLIAGIGLERSASRGNDFDNFYDSAVSVWQDGHLLSVKGILRYPPTFQVLISPFGAFPIEVAAALWILLNYAGYAGVAWSLGRLSGTPPRKQLWAWLCVLPFLVSNVTLGQSGPLLLALTSLGLWASARNRAAWGGFALASAGLLKVFPGALLAVPLALGRARGTIQGALAAVAVATVWVSFAVGPREGFADLVRWVQEVRDVQTPQALIEAVRSLRYNNQSLAISLVRSLSTDFSYDPQLAARGSLQVLSLPVPMVFALYYGIVTAMVAGFAAAIWRARHHSEPRTFLGLYALAIPLILAVLPIVWTHYFLWWLPALVYLAERRGLLAVLGVASFLANFSVTARALGFHMGISLVLFVCVARQLWLETETEHSAARAVVDPHESPADAAVGSPWAG